MLDDLDDEYYEEGEAKAQELATSLGCAYFTELNEFTAYLQSKGLVVGGIEKDPEDGSIYIDVYADRTAAEMNLAIGYANYGADGEFLATIAPTPEIFEEFILGCTEIFGEALGEEGITKDTVKNKLAGNKTLH